MSVPEGSFLKNVQPVHSMSRNVSRKGEGSGEWAQATAAMPLGCCGTASCSIILIGVSRSLNSPSLPSWSLHVTSVVFLFGLQGKFYLRYSAWHDIHLGKWKIQNITASPEKNMLNMEMITKIYITMCYIIWALKKLMKKGKFWWTDPRECTA